MRRPPLSLSWLLPLFLVLAAGCPKKDPPPKPTLTSVTPATGLATGGQSITLTGENFQEASEVLFGETPATGIAVGGDGTRLTALTPEHLRGPVVVSVTTPGGTANLPNAFRYLQPASIQNLDPSTVTAGVASTIIVRGDGLVAPVTVTVGTGTTAVSLVAGSGTDKAVPVQIPGTLASGSYPVSVVNADEQSAQSPVQLTVGAPPEPVLSSVDPAQGPMGGGNQVRLRGTQLKNPTQVLFGTTQATVQNVDANGTEVLVLAPAGTRGSVDVTLTTGAGTSKLLGAYRYQQPVVITSLEPPVVPASASATVTVRGSGMVGTCTARVTDTAQVIDLTVQSTTATAITVSVPGSLHAGNWDLSVTNGDGLSATSPQPLQVREGLNVQRITPRSGFVGESVPVEITGTSLNGVTEVLLGGVACQGVQVVTTKRVTCTAQATDSAGAVDVVINRGDQAQGRLTGGFTWYSPSEPTFHLVRVDPPRGRSVGGQEVVVSVTGLGAATPTVSVGGVAANPVVRLDDRHVRITLPAHPIAAGGVAESVAVVINGNGSTDTLPDAFLYYVRPTFSNINPTAGATVGNDAVTITGTGFSEEHMQVRFGGAEATGLQRQSTSALTCRIPAHGPGTTTLTLENEYETSQDYANAFEYVEAVRITSLEPASVSIAGGTRVEAHGSGFASGRMRLTRMDDNVQATNFTVVNSTLMRFTMPARTTAGPVALHLVDTAREGQPFSSGDSATTYVDPTEPLGGVAGGAIKRNISVSVLRHDTHAPIPGAAVFVGSAWSGAAYKGTTNSQGMLVLGYDDLVGPVNLTAAATSFENQTRVAMNAAEVTFTLAPYAPTADPAPEMATVTGDILNWQAAGYPSGVDPNRLKRIAVIYPSQERYSKLPMDPGDAFIVSEHACDVTPDGINNPLPQRFNINAAAGSTISLLALVYFYDAGADNVCTPDDTQQNPREQFIALTSLTLGVRRNIRVMSGTNPGNDISLSNPANLQSRADLVGSPLFNGGVTVRTVDAVLDTGISGVFTFTNGYTDQGSVDMGSAIPMAARAYLPPLLQLMGLTRIPTGLPVMDASYTYIYRGLAAAPVTNGQGAVVGYTTPFSQVYRRNATGTTEALTDWFDFPGGMVPADGGTLAQRRFTWNALSRSADAIQVEVARVVGFELVPAWRVFLPGLATTFQLPEVTGAPSGADLSAAADYAWQVQGFAIFPEDGFGYDDHSNLLYDEEHWEAHVTTPIYDFSL